MECNEIVPYMRTFVFSFHRMPGTALDKKSSRSHAFHASSYLNVPVLRRPTYFCIFRVSHSRKTIQKAHTHKKISKTFPSDNKQESFIVVLPIEFRRLDTGRRHFADGMSLVYVNVAVMCHSIAAQLQSTCHIILWIFLHRLQRRSEGAAEVNTEIVRLWHNG